LVWLTRRPDDFFPPYPAPMISSTGATAALRKPPRPATSWLAARSPAPVAEIAEDPVLPRHRHAFSQAMQKTDDMERNNKFV
jgi:hypothetical protein